MKYYFILIAIACFDQVTKFWVKTSFALYESREVIPGFFNLVFVTNTGAAFSMFADMQTPFMHYFFISIGLIALIGLTIYSHKIIGDHTLYPVALGMIAGGAVGNLLDRLHTGAVIDFLDFYIGTQHWPAFNVADSAIVVGVACFLIINFRTDKKES